MATPRGLIAAQACPCLPCGLSPGRGRAQLPAATSTACPLGRRSAAAGCSGASSGSRPDGPRAYKQEDCSPAFGHSEPLSRGQTWGVCVVAQAPVIPQGRKSPSPMAIWGVNREVRKQELRPKKNHKEMKGKRDRKGKVASAGRRCDYGQKGSLGTGQQTEHPLLEERHLPPHTGAWHRRSSDVG